MGKWFRVHSVSSAIGRSMLLILFMASLIAVVAMVTLFYSVPDAKAINLSDPCGCRPTGWPMK